MSGMLQAGVARNAAARPDAIAVVSGGKRISYGELERRSNQLAHLLRAAGCGRGDRVCFLAPKSIEAITALIAILKADCAYVPLDPGSPAPRLARMLDSCEPRCILATGTTADLLAECLALSDLGASQSVGWLAGSDPLPTVGRLAFTPNDLLTAGDDPVESQSSDDDPAYMLFTSGSTGAPKGVPITHSNAVHFVDWAVDYFGITKEDRLSGHPPLHFDLSVLDLFCTFSSGAELHLVSPALNIHAHKLAAFIRDAELTQWFSVPSVLSYLAKFEAVRENDFPSLERVIWCGEVLPTPTLIHWMERLPHVRFTNLYGPTETTVASSYYTLPSCPENPRDPIPIGVACKGEELLVLDPDLAPLPPGVEGDLYIAGVGMSTGYWRDAQRTAEAFVPDPRGGGGRIYRTGDRATLGSDGLVYFHGRIDAQIKSRGYRIELGEIESALHTMPELREAAVVAVESEGFEGWTICCAYVPASDAHAEPTGHRARLATMLPTYMLPTRWEAYELLPKNANGKVDRPRLRERFSETQRPPTRVPSDVGLRS